MASAHTDMRGRFLFVDGFESDSEHARAWIHDVANHCSAFREDLCDAFSYNVDSLDSYTSDHTHQFPDALFRLFEAQADGHARLVLPITFSLGSPIALMGTLNLLRSGRATGIHDLILIAPGTSPSPRITKAWSRFKKGDAPEPIPSLCNPDSETRLAIKNAFREVIRAGIGIHVLWAPREDYCPYESPRESINAQEAARLEEVPMDPAWSGRHTWEPYHSWLQHQPENLATLSKMLVSIIESNPVYESLR